jgi:cell division protein DivIC
VLVTLLNLVYILFIHNINLFYIVRSKWEADRLREEIEMMKIKNHEIQEDFQDISNNGKTLEKYAREQFYMKREQEDVFIIKSE